MKKVTIEVVINSTMYRRQAEFTEIPLVGDRITVWAKVYKNKSTKGANTGRSMVVQSRTWDNRDGSVYLRCVSVCSPLTAEDLKAVGF